ILLGVLPMIPLRTGQPEDPLLQYWVAAVPQRQRQTQPLTYIRHTGQPVLVPPVGTRPGVIMGERRPRVAACAVVLTHRAPRPLREIWTPLVPLTRREQIAVRSADRLQPS